MHAANQKPGGLQGGVETVFRSERWNGTSILILTEMYLRNFNGYGWCFYKIFTKVKGLFYFPTFCAKIF